jgi:proteasome lid subunit RPN8/RPN11
MSAAGEAPGVVELGALWEKQPCPGLSAEWAALPGTGRLRYAIGPEAQQVIAAHAEAHRDVEVGGLLAGEVYAEGGAYLIRVTEALPALYTRSSAADLTFTARTWLDLLGRRGGRPDRMTVGWYHTHPGWGVFLSGADLFTHHSFFGGPWYLALVIDPHSGEQGVFAWDGERVVRCGRPPGGARSEP